MRIALLLAILALALAAPPASAQSEAAQAEKARDTSTVTFYGHVFGTGMAAPMPANTQFPAGEDNLGLGSYDWCVSGVPGIDCAEDPLNKLVLFSTAGLVDVKSRDEFNNDGGYGRFHNERGSTKDVVLDRSRDVTARIYMSLDPIHGWSVGNGETDCLVDTPRDVGCPYPYWGWDPGYWPQWTVEATLYYAVLGEHGSGASDAPDVRPALESGEAVVVAQGRTPPTDVWNGLPGYPNVHAFDVNLGTPRVDAIPKEANFFLVFSWVSDLSGVQVSAQQWRIWTGEFFPPEFKLPVKNAFDVEFVVPQFVHDKLAILGVLNTPWGSYDVDEQAIRLTITDGAGRALEPVRLATHLDGSVAHGAHYKPVNVTYVWDYRGDGLAPGAYRVEISAQNLQGSARAACAATVVIGPQGAPGPTTPGRCGLASVEESTLDPARAPPAEGGAGARALPPIALLGLLALRGGGRR